MRISDWSSDVCSSDLFDEFTRLETIDNGKPLAFSRGDVTLALDMFRYMAGWTTKITGTTTPLSLGFPPHSYTTREPVGVAAPIVPWTFPLLLAVWKLATELSAGCSVVLITEPGITAC